MSPIIIGAIGFCAVFVFMFAGMQVGICMALAGFVGYIVLGGGFTSAGQFVGIIVPASIGDFNIALLPIFLLMGEFATFSGMMTEAYKAANTWLGRLPGRWRYTG
ncbi:MAG: TRAP-type C4-dicarboxylate transport system, large permease component [Chloroflexi bacterium]|nr:TRAP-type C4-dicarboxylate transport system, large permease component [Chloroflexota bacterium]